MVTLMEASIAMAVFVAPIVILSTGTELMERDLSTSSSVMEEEVTAITPWNTDTRWAGWTLNRDILLVLFKY